LTVLLSIVIFMMLTCFMHLSPFARKPSALIDLDEKVSARKRREVLEAMRLRALRDLEEITDMDTRVKLNQISAQEARAHRESSMARIKEETTKEMEMLTDLESSLSINRRPTSASKQFVAIEPRFMQETSKMRKDRQASVERRRKFEQNVEIAKRTELETKAAKAREVAARPLSATRQMARAVQPRYMEVFDKQEQAREIHMTAKERVMRERQERLERMRLEMSSAELLAQNEGLISGRQSVAGHHSFLDNSAADQSMMSSASSSKPRIHHVPPQMISRTRVAGPALRPTHRVLDEVFAHEESHSQQDTAADSSRKQLVDEGVQYEPPADIQPVAEHPTTPATTPQEETVCVVHANVQQQEHSQPQPSSTAQQQALPPAPSTSSPSSETLIVDSSSAAQSQAEPEQETQSASEADLETPQVSEPAVSELSEPIPAEPTEPSSDAAVATPRSSEQPAQGSPQRSSRGGESKDQSEERRTRPPVLDLDKDKDKESPRDAPVRQTREFLKNLYEQHPFLSKPVGLELESPRTTSPSTNSEIDRLVQEKRRKMQGERKEEKDSIDDVIQRMIEEKKRQQQQQQQVQ
jgi:hypothetical protein